MGTGGDQEYTDRNQFEQVQSSSPLGQFVNVLVNILYIENKSQVEKNWKNEF